MGGLFLRRGVLALIFVAAASSLAFAQSSFFSSLSGTVTDSSGAVIPGADVKIRNNGTGAEYNAITASDGGFSVPSDCLETSPGYGDCGIRSLIVNGPRLIRFDLSAVKRVRLQGSTSFEFRSATTRRASFRHLGT